MALTVGSPAPVAVSGLDGLVAGAICQASGEHPPDAPPGTAHDCCLTCHPAAASLVAASSAPAAPVRSLVSGTKPPAEAPHRAGHDGNWFSRAPPV